MTDQTLSFWDDAVPLDRTEAPDLAITTILHGQPGQGITAPTQVTANDGNVYWIKLPIDDMHRRMMVSEQVVGRLGRLVDFPTCPVALLEVPPALVGERLSSGGELPDILLHGSQDIGPTIELRGRAHHAHQDDNRHRLTLIHALFDWCLGQDPQLLHGTGNDLSAYSHDHGLFFSRRGLWSQETLVRDLNETSCMPGACDTAPRDSLIQAADCLQGLDSDQIRGELRRIPVSWGAGADELNALGRFIDHRRTVVASRLRALAAQ